MRRLFWAILVALLLFGAQGVSAASPRGSCPNENDISTQIGCINAKDTGGFVGELFRLGIGVAGGIAMLLILFGGFQILTSAGNPERLNEGKELVGSAIAGLLMIMFSTFLLKFIGVDILCIPGFGSC
ncbi:hypothetical protein HY032_01940 [Candidatus Gottesmanbacteria bacterium]|nr:hypothetical protein [Candidatus Gottesmanbacteria bacterium]